MKDNSMITASRLIVDIDGTICSYKPPDIPYSELTPIFSVINMLREYQRRGYKILLYTSRNMRTFDSNIGLINKYTAPQLIEWLDKWAVPYDELLFGKPWPGELGFYIDDRAIRPAEFLSLSEKQIHNLLLSKKDYI